MAFHPESLLGWTWLMLQMQGNVSTCAFAYCVTLYMSCFAGSHRLVLQPAVDSVLQITPHSR